MFFSQFTNLLWYFGHFQQSSPDGCRIWQQLITDFPTFYLILYGVKHYQCCEVIPFLDRVLLCNLKPASCPLRSTRVYSGSVNANSPSSSRGALPASRWLCHASLLTSRQHTGSADWCWPITPVYPRWVGHSFSDFFVITLPINSVYFFQWRFFVCWCSIY